jgi:hypothetical protein
MVIVSPNIEYGLYEDHTFVKPASPSAPFARLTYMFHDGLVKSCDDQ